MQEMGGGDEQKAEIFCFMKETAEHYQDDYLLPQN